MSEFLGLRWNNHNAAFIDVLSKLRFKDKYCDVTLACNGKYYPAHKLVLSTCSEYFEEIFDRTECKHPVIVLKDINANDLEALLNYMYLGEMSVPEEILHRLIENAESLRIKGLASLPIPDERNKSPLNYSKEIHSLEGECQSQPKKLKLEDSTNSVCNQSEENSRSNSEHDKEERSGMVSYHDNYVSEDVEVKLEVLDEDESNENFLQQFAQEIDQTMDTEELSETNAQQPPYSLKVNTVKGDKPHVCSFCPYKAKSAYTVRRHMITHTGNKPFSCSMCDYRATTKHALRMHVMKHTEEKPYSCTLCPFKARTPRSVQNHLKVHMCDQ